MFQTSAIDFFPGFIFHSLMYLQSDSLFSPDTLSITTSVSETTNLYFLLRHFLRPPLKSSFHSSLLIPQTLTIFSSNPIYYDINCTWNTHDHCWCVLHPSCAEHSNSFYPPFICTGSFSWVTHSGPSPGKQCWPVSLFYPQLIRFCQEKVPFSSETNSYPFRNEETFRCFVWFCL